MAEFHEITLSCPENICPENPEKNKPRSLNFMEEFDRESNGCITRLQYFWKSTYSWLLDLLKFAGPGWLVSIGLIDAGNYEGDLQAGAGFQYKLIWVIWWSAVLEVFFQLFSIRLGIYARLDLAQACRKNYPRVISFILWIILEVCMVANDLTQVIGFAVACEILFHMPLYAGVLLSFATTLLIFSLQYWNIRYLELCVALIMLIMCIVLFIQWSMVDTDGAEMMKGWMVPSIPSGSALVALSQIGCSIMIPNLFLQSSLVQTRKVEFTKTALRRAFIFNVIEFMFPVLLVFAASLALIALSAADFYHNPQVGFASSDITLSNTCYLFQTVAFGNGGGCILFGLSLLASSQSAVVSGTFAGQIVLEGFIDLRLPLWLRQLLTRVVTMAPALIITISAGDQGSGMALLIASSILTAAIPFSVFPLLKFTQSPKIMGPFKNRKYVSVIMWIIAIALAILNIYLIVGSQGDNTLQSALSGNSAACFVGIIFTAIISILYVALLIYLMWYPVVFTSEVDQVTL